MEGNELMLCSDGDISMGQGSSIMMWWLRTAVNPFRLSGCLLHCSQGSVPWGAQDPQHPWGSGAWGSLGGEPSPLRGDGKGDRSPPTMTQCLGNTGHQFVGVVLLFYPSWPVLGRGFSLLYLLFSACRTG